MLVYATRVQHKVEGTRQKEGNLTFYAAHLQASRRTGPKCAQKMTVHCGDNCTGQKKVYECVETFKRRADKHSW
jgi:hypothetical protein